MVELSRLKKLDPCQELLMLGLLTAVLLMAPLLAEASADLLLLEHSHLRLPCNVCCNTQMGGHSKLACHILALGKAHLEQMWMHDRLCKTWNNTHPPGH